MAENLHGFTADAMRRTVAAVKKIERMRPYGGTQRRQNIIGGSGTGGLVPVDVVEDNSGSAGSGAAYCTFAYDIYDLNGNLLAEGLQPLNSRARIIKMPCVAGTHGTAYKDADGEWVLWDCDEVGSQIGCGV